MIGLQRYWIFYFFQNDIAEWLNIKFSSLSATPCSQSVRLCFVMFLRKFSSYYLVASKNSRTFARVFFNIVLDLRLTKICGSQRWPFFIYYDTKGSDPFASLSTISSIGLSRTNWRKWLHCKAADTKTRHEETEAAMTSVSYSHLWGKDQRTVPVILRTVPVILW